MNTKVLIISYTFPPNNGIGGRRWAKFAKELARLSYKVRIITFNNTKTEKTSNWESDINLYKDEIYSLTSNYPKWLDDPSTFLDKVLYRMALIYVKLTIKGNYYDRSSYLRTKLIKEIENCIEEGFKNVVITCAPFKMSYYVSSLIDLYKDVNFIVDFRDPWIGNQTSYGYHSLSKRRQQYERYMEGEVIRKFKHITVVAEQMKSELCLKYEDCKERIKVVPNGFDKDDLVSAILPEIITSQKDKLKVVFAGTFYQGALPLLSELIEVLKSDKKLAELYHFDFYGTFPFLIKDLIPKNCSIDYKGKISLQEVYYRMNEADACSLFLTEDINYSLSTKFLEYLSIQKPVFVFSFGGETGELVENEHLGYSLLKGKIKEKLECIGRDYQQEGKLRYSPTLNIENYSVKSLVRLIPIMNSNE